MSVCLSKSVFKKASVAACLALCTVAHVSGSLTRFLSFCTFSSLPVSNTNHVGQPQKWIELYCACVCPAPGLT